MMAAAEFSISLASEPYLADHGFQGMVVLPGSAYVDMALRMERERSGSLPRVLRNLAFHTPVLLSAEEVTLRAEAGEAAHGWLRYAFYEAGQHAATLEVDRAHASTGSALDPRFPIEAFTSHAEAVIQAAPLYEALRENGNQYGPAFQRVSSIWRKGSECLGRLCSAAKAPDGERYCLHPSVLDSVTQLLAPFAMERGKTFVLQSIERLEVSDFALPERVWGHAVLRDEGAEGALVGDVRVFDQSGMTYLRLAGVHLTLLERADTDQRPALNVAIAGNFTTEPLEDSLRFWGEQFGVQLGLEFAPYNQVFQQLLDARSALRRDGNGVNVITLSLEEWARQERPALADLGAQRAEQCFGRHARHILPNGLEIAHLNRYETDYLYGEIFEDQCYLKHGISLRDGDTVVDVGANIGLFSLFVMSRCANARIFAFEPAPAVYELLKANCEAYGPGARAFNLGVADRPKTERFTFYEKSSVFSGFHSDEAADGQAIRSVVRNMLKGASIADESVEEYVEQLTSGRLARTSHDCRLTSLSHIIREQRIERIDLLKVDAEKSELDILKGIEEADWPKIGQIVLEIHDPSGESVRRVQELLLAKGYRCTVDQESLLEHAGLYNLYASRRQAGEVSSATRFAALDRNVQEFCAALRSFTQQVPAAMVLALCPRSPAAQRDAGLNAALDAAEARLAAEASGMASVRVIGSATALSRYALADYYDAQAHRVGHIPYTPHCYAALGTEIFRAVYNAKKNPYKIIVLDCDNTLWQGICGEDGAEGIVVTPAHRALQEFVLERMRGGMLLCLCSKNNESDALEVFDRRNEMLLKREHLVSWRINWQPKSQNLESLAAELGLGLDSFIFIDDNPVECAEVRINCPEVLTLQLPRDAESFPAFLEHIWALDHKAATAEDRNRTRMYQQERAREHYREQSLSLSDFIKGLELRLDISPAAEADLERASQLTQRTNQFNFTTRRRSEAEIREFLRHEGAHCMVVRASDRFGDYGLVGVVMYRATPERYKVDTLLLSCRVLGRGVEHELVSRLARRALEEEKALVELEFLPSGKNQPALDFLAGLGSARRGGDSWIYAAEELARVAYEPSERAPVAYEEEKKPAARAAATFGGAGLSECLQQIGDELRDIESLATAIAKQRSGQQPAAAAAAEGAGLESALADIWRKILGNPRIGINDNFFDVGGTSIRAVQIVATVKRELKRPLSIVSIFECPTVRLLAARLNGAAAPAGEATTVADAARRGRQRRYNTTASRAS